MLNQNDVAYEVPSNDPWMPAHTEMEDSLGPFWVRDYYVNLMGCIEQYQMCNPNKGNDPSACTKLSASSQVLVEMALNGENMGLNLYQFSIAGRIMENAAAMNMYSVVSSRGASALNGQYIFFLIHLQTR